MTPEAFCYWLQGFLELSEAKTLTPQQLKAVREHLALVFTKVTGEGAKSTAEKLEALARLPRCSGSLRLC